MTRLSRDYIEDVRGHARRDPYCVGCRWYSNGSVPMCCWWECHDGLRPCPPGKDCTVYQRGNYDGRRELVVETRSRWDGLRDRFIAGEPLRALCDEYGLNYSTAVGKARKLGWRAKREANGK